MLNVVSGLRKCPYCAETIQPDAKKCRFCGEWLVPETDRPRIDSLSDDISATRTMRAIGPGAAAARGFVQQSLIPGEQIAYRTALHWSNFAWAAILAMACIAVSGLAFSRNYPAGGLILLLVAAVFAIWIYGEYVSSNFVVTTHRVLIRVGLFRRRSLEIFLSNVESIGVEQSFFERMFGCGNLIVTGTGGTKERFTAIARILPFRRMIQQEAAGSRYP
jgi:membrane protein YdbS with pleckstrin-like domain